MAIIRAHDPRAKDFRHQVLTRLGKLCDQELSVATKKRLVDELTEFLKGKQINDELFKALGVEYHIDDDPKLAEHQLAIHVPLEYVSASITDDRENQWVSFTIAKQLNLVDLKDHGIQIEDQK